MAREPCRAPVVKPSHPADDIVGGARRSASSWLELLHPDGTAAPDTSAPTTGLLDVALMAPTAADRRSRGWLGRAFERLARELAPDGVGYVVVPRRWRVQAARCARRHGLRVGPWFLHVPPLPVSQYFIPIERRALRHAFDTFVPGHRATRRLLPTVLAASGTRLLPFLLPSTGLVVRRPGSRPLLEWLLRNSVREGESGTGDPRGTAVLVMSWRGPLGGAVLYRFHGDEPRPDVVAKVAPANGTAARHEADRLIRFGPDAERAGAIVPRRLSLTSFRGRTVLVQTALGGRPAATLLEAAPAELPDLAERVTGWLGRWHAITRVDGVPARGRLLSRLLDGLDQLERHVPGSDRYRTWLAARCEALSPASVPLVAAHNDLTMWNVLVGRDGALGIVDWEHATADSLPLADFFYAMADAVMMSSGHTDRRRAVAACVGPGGAQSPLVTRLWTKLASDLALPAGAATLAFHACWIHHGANAQAEHPDAPGVQGFIAIVQWLAEHRIELEPGAGQ